MLESPFNQTFIHHIKDLQDTNGKFDKDGLIHMINMVFWVEQDYIIKDNVSVIMVGRHRREEFS